jgi:curli biogenesis system outer membrane secretion channel CsgG
MQRIDWPRAGSGLCAVLSVALLQSGPAIAQNVIDATAKISSPPAPTMGLKRKVAIARFSNETQSGQSFLVDNSGDRIGKQAADILSARLTETGKFMMFERLDGDDASGHGLIADVAEGTDHPLCLTRNSTAR